MYCFGMPEARSLIVQEAALLGTIPECGQCIVKTGQNINKMWHNDEGLVIIYLELGLHLNQRCVPLALSLLEQPMLS